MSGFKLIVLAIACVLTLPCIARAEDCAYRDSINAAGMAFTGMVANNSEDPNDTAETVWATVDLDSDGIPDSWSVALLSSALCADDAGPIAAYEANFAIANADGGVPASIGISAYVAALGTISSEGAVFFSNNGWAAGMAPYSLPLKAANEPFSASGDFDGDGLTNKEEYDAVIVAGGVLADYIAAASDGTGDGGEGACTYAISIQAAALVFCGLVAGDTEDTNDTAQSVWATLDLDSDEIPDPWSTALLASAICTDPAVRAAYEANFAIANAEGGVPASIGISAYVAALGTMSSAGAAFFANNGWAAGMTPYSLSVGAASEPFSATGDLDEDGITNKEEYDSIVAGGGIISDYVDAASGGGQAEGLPAAGLVGLACLAGAFVRAGLRKYRN